MIEIDENIFETEEFKKEFWRWFDSLPRQERKRFQTFPSDMSELYFYNRVYSKRKGP